MQYCNGGDLDRLRSIRKRFTEPEARYILSQIVQGFKAISDMKVVHRDLKLPNILVHFKNVEMDMVLHGGPKWTEYMKNAPLVGNVEIVIADLGFAKQLDDGDLTKT